MSDADAMQTMSPTPQTPASPPTMSARMPDGRYHVMDEQGNVLGKHNSVFSAARQIHEYYGPQDSAEEEAKEPKAEARAEGDTSNDGQGNSNKNGRQKTSRSKIPTPSKNRPQI